MALAVCFAMSYIQPFFLEQEVHNMIDNSWYHHLEQKENKSH